MKYQGFTLDDFQAQAINWLREEKSVLVSAPTGTGKTIIADALVETALAEGLRVIYTAPVKALSNQKFRDYCRLHGEENVGLLTGDLVIRREAPCLVMTTEILRNMLLTGEELPGLKAVILDEIHFLDDRERGTVWEEVLIYLPATVQILGLSATLSNLQEFADWLSLVRGKTVEVVTENRRAVPLQIMYGSRDNGLLEPEEFDRRWRKWKKQGGGTRPSARGNYRGKKGGRGRQGQRGRRQRDRGTSHGQIFRMLHPRYGPYLYFVFSRRSAEACARDLGKYANRCLLEEGQERRMRDRLRTAVDEIGTEVLDPELYELYAKGIAFHHAGLHVQLKALVEDLYESKLLMVLYTTSTFALGINMPARSVVLDDIHKYDGRGTRPLTTREFMQKAGRAGRRGMDKKGHVVVRLDFDNYEDARPHLERYMRGKPEEVRSSFNLSFNSIVNLTERMDDEQVRELLDRSFLAYRLQQASVGMERRADKLEGKLQREGWNPEEPGRGPPEMRRKAKELRRLRKRQAKGMSRVWADFLHRRQFLTQIGYLGEDGQPGAGASLLKHIQIEEIFTTELALSGLVDTLSPEILFGVLCGMTNSLAPTVRLRDKLYGDARKVAKKINDIRFSDPVTGAERITGIEATWDPDLIAFGVQWAEGRTLSEISLLYWSNTDISGQLVSGFRRAKDLASQLRQVFREDEVLADRLGELMRRVSRDEVEVVD